MLKVAPEAGELGLHRVLGGLPDGLPCVGRGCMMVFGQFLYFIAPFINSDFLRSGLAVYCFD